ncbi:MAG: UDP-glucose 4-epimerase GalE [marine bacterium B5-7]|nr:MAG: UDP-glucose 4-epimerase GalE [marine bacterium B5-7]
MTSTVTALVVGGAGYIGSHVVHDLCAAGHQVVVLDNLSSGDVDNLPAAARFIKGDILEGDSLDDAMSGDIDVVFHFAALKDAGESMSEPARFAHHNITGSLRLIDSMLRAGITRIVFSSSAAVYGSPQYLPVDEQHPLDPDNYYGYTKRAIEENLAWFAQLKGLQYACLRYFNATGYDRQGRVRVREHNTGNLSPLIMEVAAGLRQRLTVFGDDYETRDGTCVRDYIHVNDLASAHLLAMDKLMDGNHTIVLNLGTEIGSTVLEIVEAARRITGRDIPIEITGRRYGDPATLVASSRQAHEMLGWSAQHSDLETIFESMCPLYGIW